MLAVLTYVVLWVCLFVILPVCCIFVRIRRNRNIAEASHRAWEQRQMDLMSQRAMAGAVQQKAINKWLNGSQNNNTVGCVKF